MAIGGTITYACDNSQDIRLVGSATVTCLANGRWTTPPRCQGRCSTFFSCFNTNTVSSFFALLLCHRQGHVNLKFGLSSAGTTKTRTRKLVKVERDSADSRLVLFHDVVWCVTGHLQNSQTYAARDIYVGGVFRRGMPVAQPAHRPRISEQSKKWFNRGRGWTAVQPRLCAAERDHPVHVLSGVRADAGREGRVQKHRLRRELAGLLRT